MKIFMKSLTKYLIQYGYSALCYVSALFAYKTSLEWIICAADNNQFTTLLCGLLCFVLGYTLMVMGITGFEDLTGIKLFPDNE